MTIPLVVRNATVDLVWLNCLSSSSRSFTRLVTSTSALARACFLAARLEVPSGELRFSLMLCVTLATAPSRFVKMTTSGATSLSNEDSLQFFSYSLAPFNHRKGSFSASNNSRESSSGSHILINASDNATCRTRQATSIPYSMQLFIDISCRRRTTLHKFL